MDKGTLARVLIALGVTVIVAAGLVAAGRADRRTATPRNGASDTLPTKLRRVATGPPAVPGTHGGDLIELSHDDARSYAVEIALDRTSGTLDLHVLRDSHEVLISQQSITAVIDTPAAMAGLRIALFPVMTFTIGSRVGSCSRFRARAPELRDAGDVSGHLVDVAIEDSEFRDVPFVQPLVRGH